MKPVIILHEAEEELWHAVKWYEQKYNGLGLTFEQEVRSGLQTIQEQPEMWPKGVLGTQKLTLQKFPFIIYYLNTTEKIWVVAFAHTSRRPYYWKTRVK